MRGPPLPAPHSPTVVAALERAAQLGTGGLLLVDRHEREEALDFAALRALAERTAGGLQALGVRPGDRVALVLPTGRDFLAAFFGAQLAGAVPVPLYPPVRLGRLADYHASTAAMVTAARARLVLADGRTQRLLGEVARLARMDLGVREVASLPAGSFQPVAVEAGALGVIQFSSGSTSAPKPVGLTHGNLVAQLETLRQYVAPGGETPVGVSWLPLYHDMGLIGALLSAVYLPGKLVLLSPQDFLVQPALWLRALSRHKGVISPAPNFAYALCLKRVKDEELDGVDLSGWSLALNGAEPVSVEVLRRFSARFARWGLRPDALVPVYGLSEASLAVTFSPRRATPRALPVDAQVLAAEGRLEPGSRELASVGCAVHGVELCIRDEAGVELPPGRVGRVHVRGPSVMQGYDGLAEATAEVLRDGWLDTGDLGFEHEGELFLYGRAKDVLVLRGANRAPQEFEEALDGLVGVRPGCAVALGHVPEGAEGEELLLLVEALEESPEDLEAQVRAAVAARTQVTPGEVVLLAPGTLPRTSSGKLRRREALRQYLAGTLSPPRPVNALTVGAELARSAAGYLRSRLT
ncbi:MAG: AMP-binding protein [Deltaproteobacteria bacterium]|nr:AMP-binding protein [Deltaproteobacteria bacterium]